MSTPAVDYSSNSSPSPSPLTDEIRRRRIGLRALEREALLDAGGWIPVQRRARRGKLFGNTRTQRSTPRARPAERDSVHGNVKAA